MKPADALNSHGSVGFSRSSSIGIDSYCNWETSYIGCLISVMHAFLLFILVSCKSNMKPHHMISSNTSSLIKEQAQHVQLWIGTSALPPLRAVAECHRQS